MTEARLKEIEEAGIGGPLVFELIEALRKAFRIIDKLTEQRNRAADRHHKQSLAKYLDRVAKFEAEIDEIK